MIEKAIIELDSECGIIVKFSNEPPADVDTCTEARVTVYKDEHGRTVALDAKCNEDESDFSISIVLSNEQIAESRTYNKALVIVYKDRNGKVIGLDIEYEWTREKPC